MVLGSHNSFSYITPYKWWMRPFHFMARCQSRDIQEQFYRGARMFDLRLRFNDFNGWMVAHGAMEFCTLDYATEFHLRWLNDKSHPASPVYVRLLLEYNSEPKYAAWLKAHFWEICLNLQKDYPNIHFFGGQAKWNWVQIFNAWKYPAPTIEDKYSSTTGTILDDWWPWLYAVTHNKRNRKKGTDKDILLIDFV